MAVEFNMTDYDAEYANFQWEVPEYYNFAGDVIDKWARDPEKLAMLSSLRPQASSPLSGCVPTIEVLS